MSLLQNYSSSGSNSRYFPSVFPDNTNLHERGYLTALPSRPTQMPPPLWSLSYSSQQEWISFSSTDRVTSLVAQMVKRLPTMRETQVRSLGREDPLEKEMAIHSSTLAWKIPWTEEPGRLHIAHGVAKIRTQLSDLTFTFYRWYFIYASPTKIKHEKWAIIFPTHFNHRFHIQKRYLSHFCIPQHSTIPCSWQVHGTSLMLAIPKSIWLKELIILFFKTNLPDWIGL